MSKVLNWLSDLDPRYSVGFGYGLLAANAMMLVIFIVTLDGLAAISALVGIGSSVVGIRSAMSRL